MLPIASLLVGRLLSISDPSTRLVGFLILGAVLVFGSLRLWLGWEAQKALYAGDGPNPEAQVNCPDCGARTTTDPRRCDYCEARLDGSLDDSDG
ncbi:MAG TPA: hypothetical protein VKA37_07265 [Halobacteriales archaeon]|nr:hypothetical protein [Halobacteriales archaeon]